MSKIVLIHPRAGIDWQSNSAVFAVELARRLDNYFEVTLLSGAECGSFSRPLNSLASSDLNWDNQDLAQVTSRWFKRPRQAIRRLNLFLPCINYLLNHPADLLLPLDSYGSLFAATCVRSLNNTPVLFVDRNHLPNRQIYLRRNLSLQPNRLVAPNPIVARKIHAIAPKQAVETIPLGINPAEFTSDGKTIFTGLTKPCILLIADLDRHNDQRIELAIKAVARLPTASLLICGQGADRQYFQDLGDRLLGRERCQVRTFAYAQMPQVYRSANVFTSAPSQAPYGLKYIEAMACGLPVVTTDNEVSRYLVGKAGIFCDVTNTEEYANSLKLALDKHWYQRQPRQNALRFSWQGISLLYYRAAFKTMLNNKHQLALPDSQSSAKNQSVID